MKKYSTERVLRMYMARNSVQWEIPVVSNELDAYFGNTEACDFFAKKGLRFSDYSELSRFLSRGKLTPLSEEDLDKAENFATSKEDLEEKLSDQTYSQAYKELEHKLEKGNVLLQAPIVIRFEDGSLWGYSGRKRAYVARKHGVPVLYFLVEQRTSKEKEKEKKEKALNEKNDKEESMQESEMEQTVFSD